MPSNTEYRYATEEDLKAYYGDDPLYYSTRGVVIVKEGVVVGVGGVCRVANQMVVFTEMQHDKVTKRDIIHAGRLLLEIIEKYTTVVAHRDDELETSTSFAAHYGFYPTGIVTEDGDVLMKVTKKWNN